MISFRKKRYPIFHIALTGIVCIVLPRSSSAVSLNGLVVTGSPAYDSSTQTGYVTGNGLAINNIGTAVGIAEQFTSNVDKGSRAVRWDPSGASATTLDTLGIDNNNYTNSVATAINDAGTSVGQSSKFVAGVDKGTRAVRWDAGGTAATELGNLGLDSLGTTSAFAAAINQDGTAAGNVRKYDSNAYRGTRAVRWDASGTAATELDNLGTSPTGLTDGSVRGINNSGLVVGSMEKYVGGVDMGERAVRWAATGTAATELANLGTDLSGATYSSVIAVNDSGTTVGYASKYVGDTSIGTRAVRWEASGTSATELGNLGTDVDGNTDSTAWAVNRFGAVAGAATKYDGDGNYLGDRAVRWNANETSATELATLSTNDFGVAVSFAAGINDAGSVVGRAWQFDGQDFLAQRAVIWTPDNQIIILNNLGIVLNPPGGTWSLESADAISPDGWVTGSGRFTPTSGDSYQRAWLAQVGLGGAWTDAITGNLNGTWGRGSQWSTGTPAMQVGDAMFAASATYSVSLDRDERTRNVTVSAGDVTLNLNGHNATTTGTWSIANGATLKVFNDQSSGTIVGNMIDDGHLIVSPTGTATLAGSISGAGDLTKQGAGTTILPSANSYSGGTTVNGGKLLANNLTGSATGTGEVTVNEDGTLGGTGAISGPVVINSGGTLAPGASIESLSVGALTFNSGATLSVELDSSASLTAASDLLSSSGSLTIISGALLAISDAALATLPLDTKFTLIAYTAGNWNGGIFSGHADDTLFALGANTFKINYNDTSAGSNFGGGAGAGREYVTLTTQLSAVPEASPFIFGGLTCVCIVIAGCIRKLVRQSAVSN